MPPAQAPALRRAAATPLPLAPAAEEALAAAEPVQKAGFET